LPKGTTVTNAHGDWTAVFRRFVNMKLQLPHFRGGFGITPNARSAISAFYAASVSLVQWLCFCNHFEQNFIDRASTWAPGEKFTKKTTSRQLLCVCIRTNKHTYTACEVLNASPGVGRTPEEPEKSRSIKALYIFD